MPGAVVGPEVVLLDELATVDEVVDVDARVVDVLAFELEPPQPETNSVIAAVAPRRSRADRRREPRLRLILVSTEREARRWISSGGSVPSVRDRRRWPAEAAAARSAVTGGS